MKGNGLMIKHTGMEYIRTQMERSTKVTGKKTNRTGMEFKHGPIRLAMKEIMSKARSKVLVNLHGQMALIIRVNLKTIIFMVKVGNSDTMLFLNHN